VLLILALSYLEKFRLAAWDVEAPSSKMLLLAPYLLSACLLWSYCCDCCFYYRGLAVLPDFFRLSSLRVRSQVVLFVHLLLALPLHSCPARPGPLEQDQNRQPPSLLACLTSLMKRSWSAPERSFLLRTPGPRQL